jgi:hypothetical protein
MTTTSVLGLKLLVYGSLSYVCDVSCIIVARIVSFIEEQTFNILQSRAHMDSYFFIFILL